jgi:hypothetical protein
MTDKFKIELTDEEWDEVQDALSVVEAAALDDARMWVGRVREGRYMREADAAKALWNKIQMARGEEPL